jgi:hypothetical protein
MNLKEAIEGFIVMYIALLVGAYSKHHGLLFIVTFIAFIISIVTETLAGFALILYMSVFVVFLGTLYLFVTMLQTATGRQQIVKATGLVKSRIKQVFA